MSSTWLMVVLFVSLAVFLLVGQWTAFALGIVGVLVIVLSKGYVGLQGLSSVVWNNANSYILIAVPMFLLMGEIILRSGVSKYFYAGVATLLRRLPGGLLHANIVSCAIFSAVSGSSVATAASVGTVAIPELLRAGYQPRAVFGSLAAGGTLGILIPPSIVMVLYAALVEESVGRLFIAGITGVYDRVTEGATFPYIVIGEAFSRDWSTKTTNGTAVNCNLHIFSKEAGRKQVANIMNRMHTLLHNASLTLVENTLISLQFLSSDIVLEEDGYTYHGIMRFRALTQSIA